MARTKHNYYDDPELNHRCINFLRSRKWAATVVSKRKIRLRGGPLNGADVYLSTDSTATIRVGDDVGFYHEGDWLPVYNNPGESNATS